MLNSLKFTGLYFLVIIIFTNIVVILFYNNEYIHWLETNISRDGNVQRPDLLISHILFLLIVCTIFWIHLFSKTSFLNVKIILNKYKFEIFSFSFLFISFFMQFIFKDYAKYYVEDSFFENLTAVLFAIAGLLLFYKIFKEPISMRSWIVFFIALIFLFIAGEEISWGQRIFGWETSDAWKEINYQDETTLHNLYNPYTLTIQSIINAILFLVFHFWNQVSILLRKITFFDFKTLCPNVNLFTLYSVLFIPLMILSHHTEIFEEILSMVAFSYAIRFKVKT